MPAGIKLGCIGLLAGHAGIYPLVMCDCCKPDDLMTLAEKWQVVTGVCSLGVAIIAAVFAFWQLHVGRKHNRLSVRPILVQKRNPKRAVGSEHYNLSLVLYNPGTGPALIESVRWKYQGECPAIKNSKELSTLLRRYFSGCVDLPLSRSIEVEAASGGGVRLSGFEAFMPDSSTVIQAGSSLTLMEFTYSASLCESIKAAFDALDVEVVYDSIYMERFVSDAYTRRAVPFGTIRRIKAYWESLIRCSCMDDDWSKKL